MTRATARPALLALVLLGGAAPAALAQAPPAKPLPDPRPARFRLVLDGLFGFTTSTYADTRTLTEYAEETSIRTSYETGTGFGAGAALQVSLFQGLGILVGYSALTRDATGTVDVTRPHPLYLSRPRTASAELSGYGYKEGALDLDVAFARTAGHLDWALFGGVTLFQVEADLLGTPAYDEKYPYDELGVTSTPPVSVQESTTGFNVGGRLDYRFGSSRRFGAGVTVRYAAGTVKLKATPDATEASLDAGGLTVGAGLRVYF